MHIARPTIECFGEVLLIRSIAVHHDNIGREEGLRIIRRAQVGNLPTIWRNLRTELEARLTRELCELSRRKVDRVDIRFAGLHFPIRVTVCRE